MGEGLIGCIAQTTADVWELVEEMFSFSAEKVGLLAHIIYMNLDQHPSECEPVAKEAARSRWIDVGACWHQLHGRRRRTAPRNGRKATGASGPASPGST